LSSSAIGQPGAVETSATKQRSASQHTASH
jgi:hypothetical protein